MKFSQVSLISLLAVSGISSAADHKADVVVYDRLAHPSLLDLAPTAALRIDVGKAPGRVAMDQDGINATLVEHGSDFDEARLHARHLAERDGLLFAPSFHAGTAKLEQDPL